MEVGRFDSSVGMIIQARMASTRLPGKVLMPIPIMSEQTILGQICESLKPLGGQVIVATSTNEENDAIEVFCKNEKIECFRGSEDDVFSRFLAIQQKYQFIRVFRFTADNPFIDLEKLFQFYHVFLEKDIDYAYSTGMPLGMNFELLKGETIATLATINLSDQEREHVTLGIRNSDEFSWKRIRIANKENYRLTVDGVADYLLSSTIFQLLGDRAQTVDNIVRIFTEFPWLSSINDGILQKCSTDILSEQKVIIAKYVANHGYQKVANYLLDEDFKE